MAFELVYVSADTDSAVLEFEFTGGDSSYGNYRPLWLTIDGTKYSDRKYDSDESGGGDSYWTIVVSGLTPGTTYDVSAQLGYYTGTTPAKLQLFATGSFTTEEEIIPVYIYSGDWVSAIPHIWSGGRWVKSTASIYSGGWKP